MDSEPTKWSGRARLQFDNPPEVIEGPAVVVQDSVGRLTLEVNIEKLDTDSEAAKKFGQFGFFGNPASDAVMFSLGGENPGPNTCKEIILECDDYVLRACGNLTFSCRLDDALNLQGKGRLTFNLREACWRRRQTAHAVYWSAPLLNFVSEYAQDVKAIEGHPLLPDKQKRVILYKCHDALGFVHDLPDYANSIKRLQEQRDICLPTARIVGNVAHDYVTAETVKEWFPTQLLDVLSFATGREVGLAWIDFWDSIGNHVARSYIPLHKPVFTSGRGAFYEATHVGTGRLLTLALEKTDLRNSYLTVVMNYLVKGGLYSETIEDQFRTLFVTFDRLCRENVQEPDLRDMLGECEPSVRELFESTASRIGDMRQSLRGQSHEILSEALCAMENYAKRWTDVRPGFGRAVEQLLRLFDMVDAGIMNKYLRCHPFRGRNSFRAVMSYYRGIVIHQGFINFREEDHDVYALIAVANHMHDIATRIVLKLLGYHGAYQPTMFQYPCRADLDWVKADTPASRLGYTQT